nr:reverse transcriptase domain, reverse transcriptase zinc-binding domain protein [Tanacetum cinerariifolium]
MELINLCFADDLFLFSHGDDKSAKVIMEALDEFKLTSGLVPSLPKSTAYFCNVLNCTKQAILQIMPFEEGRLPIKYLGVPLVPSRLIYKDCKELIEKVDGHINDWKNKSLSIAGRLQLIHSVISSLHVYWASMFVLPSGVLLDIEQRMRGFLWCQGKGKSKLRPLIRKFIWYKLGNGQSVSFWYDNWCSLSPLANLVSTREMYRAGLTTTSK